MTVRELQEWLKQYDPDKEISLVDWTNGIEYDFSVNIDDITEDVCIILGEVI